MENTHYMNCMNDKSMRMVDRHIFERLYCKGAPDYEEVSLIEVLKIWGYAQFYDRMIEHFKRLIKSTPTEHLCFHYDTGTMDNRQNVQKLFGWDIFDEGKKKFGLVGGVLFQNGEMSFHT